MPWLVKEVSSKSFKGKRMGAWAVGDTELNDPESVLRESEQRPTNLASYQSARKEPTLNSSSRLRLVTAGAAGATWLTTQPFRNVREMEFK
jgi:hypothetical protein